MNATLNRFSLLLLLVALLTNPIVTEAKKKTKEPEKEKKDTLASKVSGLKLRGIGPSFASGRIADFAVNPDNPKAFFVAVASGHIWKTENNGQTFKPVFDNYGAYSIGCLAMDSQNHNVIWAGTGENNHQRALGYGDGIYKSVDGGKSWKNMGLKNSRHIGMICIDPRNSNVVYAAAEGSAWGPGGDRGLYKTTDGGKNWECILEISENTGINNVICDPRNPDILYATSEQRRRHVHTKIGGGPESAIHKSEDGGKTWRKLTSGLPSGHVGGMGIAISPQNPDVLYIIAEAGKQSGFYRSEDRGESWKKMSDHAASGQYYNEIYCDPVEFDKVYSVETISHVTTDGGKTWKRLGLKDRHVDDHALWINPGDNKHWMIGGDGGVYITYDNGDNFFHVTNLPVIQFYRVTVDNAEPFYNVYGGTQDNASMGGPSQNINAFGVKNHEWNVTVGGDGFWSRVDPENPDIVYSEWQYGNVVRYDKKSGERISIKPQPRKGEATYKWNWNAPIIISPHKNTQLYISANKVFRSEDRGNSWTAVSPDLTAKIDRNKWPVMGKYWSSDAIAKDVSTSQYGTIVSFDESPVKKGLLYAGTDDGVISITENADETEGAWTQLKILPGIPENTYVSDIFASRFDENVVYASFDNRKRDDFKPYILKSNDKGKTWISIASNLPENGTVHTIEQDHINPDLLFVGTEFGLFFSYNDGKNWVQLKSGLPAIAVRDLAIQQRENDLALATFGRGFYLLEDYSPLREFNPEMLKSEAKLFPVKDALLYMQTGKVYGQGATYWAAKNPPFGACFTLYLKDEPKTAAQARRKEEKKLFKEGEKIPQLTFRELELEKMEVKPYLIFTIYDEEGNVVRKMTESPKKGINRYYWDLEYATPRPVRQSTKKFDPLKEQGGSVYAMPGQYKVSVSMYAKGEIKELIAPVAFNVVPLNNTTLPAPDRKDMVSFQREVSKVTRQVLGAEGLHQELIKKVVLMQQTILTAPGASNELIAKLAKLEKELEDIRFAFEGSKAKASWEEVPPEQMPLKRRLRYAIYTQMNSTSAITETTKISFEILKKEIKPFMEQLKWIAETDIPALNKALDAANANWTPGRIPVLD